MFIDFSSFQWREKNSKNNTLGKHLSEVMEEQTTKKIKTNLPLISGKIKQNIVVSQ